MAVDESGRGRDAIALAKRLVGPDGKLTLAHVLTLPAWEPWASGAAYAAGEQAKSVGRERAQELLRSVSDEAGITLRSGEVSLERVWSSSVGRGLHELAESEGAGLLVLGSSRRGLLGRVLVGDHTRAALNGAPCAVALAPAGYCDHFGGIRRIGVGHDGSVESEQALEIARRLPAARDAELSACTAVSVPLPVLGPGPLPVTDVIEPLFTGRASGSQGSAAWRRWLVTGLRFDVLARYSESVDLLVVGSRSDGPLGRLVHGSTSEELARTARCALLVLARSARSVAWPDDSEERGAIASPDRAGLA